MEFTPEAQTWLANQPSFIYHKVTTDPNMGYGSPAHIKILESFTRSLVSVVGLGGKMMTESDSMLIGYNDHLTFGLYRHSDGTYSVNS